MICMTDMYLLQIHYFLSFHINTFIIIFIVRLYCYIVNLFSYIYTQLFCNAFLTFYYHSVCHNFHIIIIKSLIFYYYYYKHHLDINSMLVLLLNCCQHLCLYLDFKKSSCLIYYLVL